MATHTTHPTPRIVDLDVGGMKPFYSAQESAQDCLTEAHAILTLMATAFHVSEGMGDRAFTGPMDGLLYENGIRTLRDGIKAQALHGVARLVATALYCDDLARSEAA